ncbi:MAG: hypothetical protein LBL45_07375 [Treponema sp.]|jgi:hypothetical protein|nr:hypothetical protein [Treponema sp.]
MNASIMAVVTLNATYATQLAHDSPRSLANERRRAKIVLAKERASFYTVLNL